MASAASAGSNVGQKEVALLIDGITLELKADGKDLKRTAEFNDALTEYGRAMKANPIDPEEVRKALDAAWKAAWKASGGSVEQQGEECNPVEVGALIDLLAEVDTQIEGKKSGGPMSGGSQTGGGVMESLMAIRDTILQCIGMCGRRASTSANNAVKFLLGLLDREEANRRNALDDAAEAAERALGPDPLKQALRKEGTLLLQYAAALGTAAALTGAADPVFAPLMSALGPMTMNAFLGIPSYVAFILMRMGAMGALCVTGGGLAAAVVIKMAILKKAVSTVGDVAAAATGAMGALPENARVTMDALQGAAIAKLIGVHAAMVDNYPAAFAAAANAMINAARAAPGAAMAAAAVGMDVARAAPGAAAGAAAAAADRISQFAASAASAAAGALEAVEHEEELVLDAARGIIGAVTSIMQALDSANPGIKTLIELLREALEEVNDRIGDIFGEMDNDAAQLQGAAAAPAAAPAAGAGVPPAAEAADALAQGPAMAAAIRPNVAAPVDIGAQVQIALAQLAAAAAPAAAPGVGSKRGRDDVNAAVDPAKRPRAAAGAANGSDADDEDSEGDEELPGAPSGLAPGDKHPTGRPMGGRRCHSCGNVFGKTRRAARGKKSKKSGKTAKKGGKKAVRKGSFRKGRKHSKKQRR
jgi:hypothetical protein